MISREVIPILVVLSCLSPIAVAQEGPPNPATIESPSAAEPAQDFSQAVVPIASSKLTPSVKFSISGKLEPKLNLDSNFGTGFCLDAKCRFIATNYHVAVLAPTRKIKGEKIIQRYFATGPQDNGATVNSLPNGGLLLFAMKRDLAILELRASLPHHHGLPFDLGELEVGQEVDIYGYPKGMINPIRKLTRFPATFKAPTTAGLLAFEYQSSADKPIRIRGASGGIVVDRKTERIVGILSQTNETMALAVPVQTLADFVSKVQPFLAQKLFPSAPVMEVSPVSVDLYPKFMPPRADALQHRAEEPYEVQVLRKEAQSLVDGMRNFIAVQSFAWGSGRNEEPAARADYEVRVMDGVQTFRVYPDGKQELGQPPSPFLNNWTTPADEWSSLAKMVGTEFRLKVRQVADTVVNERRMKVFQYYASVEDHVCGFEAIDNYALFTTSKIFDLACYGEVWTDADGDIVRISKNLDFSEKVKSYRGWELCHIVVTYARLNQPNQPSRLVPWTLLIESRWHKSHLYWCRGHFTHYQRFITESKFIPVSNK